MSKLVDKNWGALICWEKSDYPGRETVHKITSEFHVYDNMVFPRYRWTGRVKGEVQYSIVYPAKKYILGNELSYTTCYQVFIFRTFDPSNSIKEFDTLKEAKDYCLQFETRYVEIN